MTKKHLLLGVAGAALMAVAGGAQAVDANPVTTTLAPVPTTWGAASAGVAIFDFNLSLFDLSRDPNDGDFDAAGVLVLNGQARFRMGNLIGEIQGTTTTSVDDGDDDENSTSFGMFGHYVGQPGAGQIAFGLGIAGGTNVEESDGTWYALASVAYARGGWMVGLGRLFYLWGQDTDDSLTSFTYLQGSYTHAIGARTDLFVAGYYGMGRTSDDPIVTGYNIELGIGHAFSDQLRGTASLGRFGLLRDGDPRANGYSLSLGLTVAIGATVPNARDAIRFDTPNLHREITWCDEASC